MDTNEYLEDLEIWTEFFATQLSNIERVSYDGLCSCFSCKEIRELYLIYKKKRKKEIWYF